MKTQALGKTTVFLPSSNSKGDYTNQFTQDKLVLSSFVSVKTPAEKDASRQKATSELLNTLKSKLTKYAHQASIFRIAQCNEFGTFNGP